jgi:hypothetical protein
MPTAVRVSEPELAALVGLAAGEGSQLPVALRERLEPIARELAPGLDAIVRPRRRLDIEYGGERATCWFGATAACVVAPAGDGTNHVLVVEPREAPEAVMRVVSLTSAGPPAGRPLSIPPQELAVALALRARGERPSGPLAPVLADLRGHWRISSDLGAVEVLDTGAGPWMVTARPAGGGGVAPAAHEARAVAKLELRPVDAGAVGRALAGLFAAGDVDA